MGTLSFLNSKFYFSATSRVETQAALEAGLKFDAGTLRWVTRNFTKARALRRFADGSAERKLKRYFITKLAPPECIVFPDHLAPRSWQIESAWHLVTRTPAYDADEAGLGKSATAIMAVNSVPGNTLIICPPYLKYNWLDELNTWLSALSGAIVDTGSTDIQWGADVLIMPDSLLTRPEIQAKLNAAAPFKWIIVDEFHRFKTAEAKRTRVMVGGKDEAFNIADLGERLIFLSGTPFPNGKPIELYAPLSELAPESIGYRDAVEFGKKFCAGKRVTRYEGGKAITAWDFQGASNLSQLKKELREKLMIRHTKKECLTELGPKSRRLIFLDTPKKIEKLEKKKFAHLEIKDLLGEGAKLGDIAEYRREVGEAKIKPALEYLTELLKTIEGKVIVAAYHVDVVEKLCNGLLKFGAMKIRGGMSAKEKARAVNLFQTGKSYRVMVGNTLSMGLGLTLTSASRGVFVEPEWTPGTNEQMEDRIHRISQTEHVLWDYLVLRGSLDERMLRQALTKESNIHTLMN